MKGTSPREDRWEARRASAFVLRSAIFLVPVVVGFTAGSLVAHALPEPVTPYDIASWWALVIGASTVSATLTDRLARRLLPLTILLKMTMLFPDRAPSRMRVALRAGNFTELRKRITRAQEGADSTIGEMSELILSLSTALSQHDRKTRGHSERTRAYTDIIAAELGLSESDRDKLRWAALLHDVGKLEVPAEILNKDSKLTDEEWHLVRQHPVLGMKLVGPLVPWLGEWAKTIEHHHERWDGTGYPHGLAGTEIALGARIVSVGDAYDVMTSGRAYQKAKTPAAARQEIARMAGSQFDPMAVRALMNVSLGKLRWATGPIAMLAELPFVRGLPNVGRDAATLLTSSAVVAGSLAVGIIPTPADLGRSDILDIVAAGTNLPVATDSPASTTTTVLSGSTSTDAPTTTTTTIPTTTTTVDDRNPTTSTTTTSTPPTTQNPTTAPPATKPDSATTKEDTPVVVPVLANDTDPDGDLDPASLSAEVPGHGTITISGGKVTYTPAPNYNGADGFEYAVCDTSGNCSASTATIKISSVNDPPRLTSAPGVIDEDTVLTLPLQASDVDGDGVTCALADAPAVGAATVPASCSDLVFNPPANFNGSVTIPVVASDGHSQTSYNVAVTVRPVNDAPVAADDSATIGWQDPADISVTGNDTDVDGDALTVSIVGQPSSGTASLNGSQIRYTPGRFSTGVYSIDYQICDPSGACDTATLTVTVLAITIARDDSAATDNTRSIVIDLINNDTAGNSHFDRRSFRLITPASHGGVNLQSRGRARYTAQSGYVGTDTFVYEVCDTAGSCDTATVTITVSAG